MVTLGDAALGFGKFRVAIVMNRGQRFSFFHAIADALVEFEAHGVIDLVFLFSRPPPSMASAIPNCSQFVPVMKPLAALAT